MSSARPSFVGARQGLVALLVMLAVAAVAPAQSTWNNGNGDRQWGTAGNWSAGVPNSTTAIAQFAGQGTGAVTVGANFTVNTLNFSAGDYTLGGTGTLTVPNLVQSAGNNTIANRLSAVDLSSTISGGTLSLTNINGGGANSFTGNSAFIVLTGGTLSATVANGDPFNGGNTASALGDARVVLNGGTLTIQGNLVSGGLTGQVFPMTGAAPTVPNFNNFNPEFGPQTNANGFAMQRTRLVMNTLPPPETLQPSGATAALTQVTFPTVPFSSIGSASTTQFYSRWSGAVQINTGGTYTFGTRSDDGSLLYVDGVRVVDNNSFQGLTLRSGTISLNPGLHTIELYHYQGGGGGGMELAYTGPDQPGTLANSDASMTQFAIPTSRLFARQATVNMPTTNIDVSGTSALNLRDASVINMNALTLAPSSQLNVGGTSAYGRFATTTLNGTGTRTFTINTPASATANSTPGSDLGLGVLSGVNGATIIKQGDGNLMMDIFNQAATQPGLTYEIQGGRLVASATYQGLNNPTNPIGDQATVRLNGPGATLHLRSYGTSIQDFQYDNALQVNASGAVEVSAGNASFDALYILGSAGRGITLSNNATLTVNVIASNGNGGTNRFVEFQNGGPITGTGNIIKSGGGEFNVTTTNSFTGTTTVQTGGDVVASATNALGTAAGNTITVNSGGTLGIRGTVSLANPLTINGGGATFRSGALEASRNFTAASTDPVFNGPITLSGAATIGTNVNSLINSFTLGGNINVGGNALTVNAQGGATPDVGQMNFNGVISGTGSVNKTGPFPMLLAGNNTYSGGTTITQGTVEARGNGASAVGTGPVTVTSSTLNVTGANALGNANASLNAFATMNINLPSGGTVAAGGTSFSVNEGSAINVRAGSNLSLNNAVVNFASQGFVPGLREGFIRASNDFTTANPGNGPNNPSLTVRMGQISTVTQNPLTGWSDNTTWVYTGQIRANGNFLTFAEQVDDSTWVRFNGNVEVNNTSWFTPSVSRAIPVTPGQWYDVEIRVANGTGGAGPPGSNVNGGWGVGWSNGANNATNPGTLAYGVGIRDGQVGDGLASAAANAADSTTNIKYDGKQYFKPGDTTDTTTGYAGLNGTRVDPITLDAQGFGRFRVLTSAGTVNLEAGTSASFKQTTGGAQINMAAGSAVTYNNSGSPVASTADIFTLTGNANLTVGTNHTLSLSGGVAIPSGSTLTKDGAGRLNVNGSTGTGTGTLNFIAGTLGGNGSIAGPVTMAAATTLAPGTSVGKLTTGPLTLSGGTYQFEYQSTDQTAISNPSNYGITHDVVTGTGALTLSGTITINIVPLVFPSPQPGATTYTIAAFTSISGTPTFAFTGAWAAGTSPTAQIAGGNLNLTFTPVPEPVQLLTLCAAVGGLAGWLRRRRSA
jgi:autotransporter-associated beta strand protein